MARRGFPPWRCAGCGKAHPVTVEIEGVNHAGKWCLRGIKTAHRAGRNDVPRHPVVHGHTARL